MLYTTDGYHLATRDPQPCATFPTSDVVVSTLHTSLPWEGLTVKHATAGAWEGRQGAAAATVRRGTTCCPLPPVKTISPWIWGHLCTHTTFIHRPLPHHCTNKWRIPSLKDKHIRIPGSSNWQYAFSLYGTPSPLRGSLNYGLIVSTACSPGCSI